MRATICDICKKQGPEPIGHLGPLTWAKIAVGRNNQSPAIFDICPDCADEKNLPAGTQYEQSAADALFDLIGEIAQEACGNQCG